MYQVGEYIIYGGDGVCRVDAVGRPPFAAADPDRTYYTLTPVYHTGVIYAPTDVTVKMRPVLTREEAWALIRSIPGREEAVAFPKDAKLAALEYQTILRSYDSEDLLRLIRMIHAKNRESAALGKAIGQTDDRFSKRAKELLYGELATALTIPVGEVEGTIVRMVEAKLQE